jgi:hypothetical protein
MKDALGIAHFAPALTAIMNWQDRSYQLTPELQYTGLMNLELLLRLLPFAGRQRHLHRREAGSAQARVSCSV